MHAGIPFAWHPGITRSKGAEKQIFCGFSSHNDSCRHCFVEWLLNMGGRV